MSYTNYTNSEVKKEHITLFEHNIRQAIGLHGYNLKELATRKISGNGNRVIETEMDGNDIAFAERTSQFEKTPIQFAKTNRRQLTRKNFHQSTKIDKFDTVDALMNTTGMKVNYFAKAYAKLNDLQFIASLKGDNVNVVDGDQNVGAKIALPTSQILKNATAPKAFSIETLHDILYTFDNNLVDDEQIILLHDENVLQQLLKETKIQSSDYNNIKALIHGEVSQFMGIQFKKVNSRVLSDANADGTKAKPLHAIALTNTAMAEWDGLDFMVEVKPDPDSARTDRIQASGSFGYGRLEEKKVLLIEHSKYKINTSS